MSPLRFNFPPVRYSAVYTGDITSANVVNAKPVEGQISPVSIGSDTSLFNCFHCAFSNGIKVIRKEKVASKSKVILCVGRQYVTRRARGLTWTKLAQSLIGTTYTFIVK